MQIHSYLKVITCSIFIIFSTSFVFGKECLVYEVNEVSLLGLLSRKAKKASELAIEKREYYWLLHLFEPVCFKEGKEYNEAESEVWRIQLVILPWQYKQYKKHLNTKVKIKGRLFHAHTAHHLTRVLMEVEQITSLKNNN